MSHLSGVSSWFTACSPNHSKLQVLFLQGGASTAFANVPLNLTKAGDSVDHIVTGSWSKKAAQEAQKYCKVNVAAKGDNKHVPSQKDWKLQKQAKYLHYCDNETIQVQLLPILTCCCDA